MHKEYSPNNLRSGPMPAGSRFPRGNIRIANLPQKKRLRTELIEHGCRVNVSENKKMMAAAEARAAWQRTANRCIVQEDAKRAPKLACCPSSSSSSKPQVDTGPGDTANETDHPPAGFMPLNWNTSNSNLPPDTKWWLQLQPNFGHQKDFTYEQLNALEAELESLRAENVNGASKNIVHPPATGEDVTHVDINKSTNTGFSLDPNWRVPATCVKNDSEAKMHELKSVSLNNKQQPLKHKDVGECWYRDEGLVDLDPIDQFISKQPDKLCFDMESPWIGSGKTEPWWRTVDKDELASLVAQKSLENIENCDLPPPQIMKVRRGPFTCLESFDHDGIFSPSLDPKANSGVCNLTEYTQGSPTCGFGEKGHSLYGSDNLFSYSGTNSHSSTNKDSAENRQTSESEPSKAELLEALRHSQTRAREAEKAAQEAYNEKEHIIKLFFKQASHLFAYKQWLQLLQLETICFQLKHKDHPISNFFPVTLPWMPHKQGKRGKHKAKKGKRSRYEFGKYAIAFALGVGLASAGLLLGWTMGWLFPMV